MTSIAVAPLVFAATPTTPVGHTSTKQVVLVHSNKKGASISRRGLGGTVTAISGTTITLTSGGKNPKTYTINASKAHIVGIKLASLSTIHVGDTIVAMGTITGTILSATTVIDRPAGTATPKAFTSLKTKTTH